MNIQDPSTIREVNLILQATNKALYWGLLSNIHQYCENIPQEVISSISGTLQSSHCSEPETCRTAHLNGKEIDTHYM